MAYAIIKTGGKQFRVAEGATVRVPSIDKKVGESVELDVLLLGGDGETKVGGPMVSGARVTASVTGHDRAPKITVFKKKRRKHYKRTKGHRQGFTTLKVDSIG
ncbi:MAG: large subunit ribosomal protein [Blastocatellia bacterium]|jgi:large subunit ribosomal protein L21|nr:large subunit ribosomal protein [Blastocatellia bacterium]